MVSKSEVLAVLKEFADGHEWADLRELQIADDAAESFFMAYNVNTPIWNAFPSDQTIQWNRPPDLASGADIGVSVDGLTITINTNGIYVLQLDTELAPVDNTGQGRVDLALNAMTGKLATSFLGAGNGLGATHTIDAHAMSAAIAARWRTHVVNTSLPVDLAAGDTFKVHGYVADAPGIVGSGLTLAGALLTIRRIG